MKKAIFLVDDIRNGKIYTLLESAYDKLNIKLDKEGRGQVGWLSEIATLLNNDPSDFIRFEKASEFVKAGKIPEDRDVFYFISCYHQLDFFTVTNFLLMDPEVTDFLVKHKIPVVMDSSMESVNHYDSSYRLLEHFFFSSENIHQTHASLFFRNLQNVDFYIVGSTHYYPPTTKRPNRKVKAYHSVFPGPFFQYNARGLHFNRDIVNNREERFEQVKNRKITEDTLVWQAFSNKTRLNRGLFLLKAQQEGLSNLGKYSRLIPGRQDFERDFVNCNMEKFKDRLSYVSNDGLKSLDNVSFIDDTLPGVSTFNDFSTLVRVSLETYSPDGINDVTCTCSFLTEKTAMAIGSAMPFIPVGGHKIGEQLKQAGFREYANLKFPTQPNLLDEVDYVVDCLKRIAGMSLAQKQALYDEWKDTIVYNYDRYLNIDVKKYYLEILNRSRHQATAVN
jgi:hypothetical protein